MQFSLKSRVEIPVFLLFFSIMLSASVFANLLIYRTCYVALGYNKSECALLGTKNATEESAKLERLVEPVSNMINMTKMVVGTIVGTVLCLFLGPWSDKHGRRPVLISALTGFVFGHASTTFFSFLDDASPWFFLTPVLGDFPGGLGSYTIVSICYITDVTTEDNRGIRMGLFEASLYSGLLLGTLASSFVFDAVGYTATFAICLLAAIAALLYTVFCIPESVQLAEDLRFQDRLRDLFTTHHLKDTYRVAFKRRERNGTLILFLVLAMMFLYVFASSDGGMFFVFMRNRFSWSLERYTIFQAASGVWGVLGTIFVVVVLHKILQIPEDVLILVGLLSMLDGALMLGLATNSTHVYAGAVVKVLGGGVSPMARTLVTKIVVAEELGKMFAFMVPLEIFAGTVVTPIYTLVYNATIDSLPSAYNFVTAGVIVLQLFILMAVIVLQRKGQNGQTYVHLNEEVSEIPDVSNGSLQANT